MNRKTGILIFLILFSATTYSQLDINSNLNSARKELSEGKNQLALERLNRLIKFKPDLFEPYFFRGIAKYGLNDYTGAIEDFSKVIDLNPFLPDAFYYRGIAKNSLQHYNEALIDFDRAASLDINNPGIFINRGLAKLNLKNYSSAIEDFEKVLHINPYISEVYMYRGIAKAGLKEYELAISDLNKSIGLNQFSDEAYTRRGIVRLEQEKYQDALIDFNKSLKINSANPYTYYLMALTHYYLKDFETALKDYNKVIELSPYNALAYYNRAMLKIEIGDKTAALSDLDKVVQLNPNHLLTYYNRGIIKTDFKQYEGAIKDFSMAIQLYPEFAEAYYMRSVNKLSLKQTRAAETDYKIAMEKMKIQKSDTNLVAINAKKYSKIIELEGDFNSSFAGTNAIYSVYSGIDPLSDFVLEFSKTEIKDNDLITRKVAELKEFKEYFVKITNRNDSTINFDIVKTYLDKNIKNSKQFEYFLGKALIAEKFQDFNAAIEAYNNAIELKHDNAFLYLGRAHTRQKMFEFILSIDESSQLKMDTQNKSKQESTQTTIDYSLVFEDINKAIDINPDLAIAYYNRANLRVKTNQFKDALFDFERAIKLEPEFADAYYNMALLLIHLQENSKACSALSKAGELGQEKAWIVIKRYCDN